MDKGKMQTGKGKSAAERGIAILSFMPMPARNQWTVTATDAGVRLDLFLGVRLNLGRQPVRRLLESGRVRCNNRQAGRQDKGYLLAVGTTIEVVGASTEEVVVQPEMPLTVLNQGQGWAILDKQPRQPVHPLRPGERGTLLNALAARFPQITTVGEGGLRGGVVHRLDIDTSGAVLFATEQGAWAAFRRSFQEHTAEKIYMALVRGHPPETGQSTMRLHIARHRPAYVRIVPSAARSFPTGSRLCDLRWRVIEQYASAAQVEIRLGTGFLHQIRAMFAAMGHPVLGDATYGYKDSAPRQMLHAWRLHVNQAQAESPLPQDFRMMIEACRNAS
jgi:23S rRNA pseudouridine1911/1915/1917 synthase